MFDKLGIPYKWGIPREMVLASDFLCNARFARMPAPRWHGGLVGRDRQMRGSIRRAYLMVSREKTAARCEVWALLVLVTLANTWANSPSEAGNKYGGLGRGER